MKKNININLCGIIYAIDEDAYQLLEQYLDNIKAYFSRQQGGEEIADDIEHRVAELLWEKKQQGVEAIDVMTIKTILKQIGNPEEMTDETSATQEETSEQKKSESASEESKQKGIYGKQEAESGAPAKKRLFRDPRDKKLGGVLSGMAQYFGMQDPLLLRVIYVLLTLFLAPTIGSLSWTLAHFSCIHVPHILFFNIFIVIYVFAWILIPEAKTAEDRLMMKGKPITPETIKEEVIEDEELKKKVNSSAPAPTSQSKGCANGCLSVIATLVKVFVVFIVGVVFLSVAFALLVTLFVMAFSDNNPLTLIDASLPWGMKMLVAVMLLIMLGLPIYVLCRQLFSKSKIKSNALLWLLLLWITTWMSAIPVSNYIRRQLDLDNFHWQWTSTDHGTKRSLFWDWADWNFSTSHTETYTEPDGTQVTVRHHKTKTKDCVVERTDTIRTPSLTSPQGGGVDTKKGQNVTE